jgi:hypothetical protein
MMQVGVLPPRCEEVPRKWAEGMESQNKMELRSWGLRFICRFKLTGGGEFEVDNSRLTETIPRRWLPPPTPIHD